MATGSGVVMMEKMVSKPVLREESGAALPSVLIVITIITLMAGVVMSGAVIQSRFIKQDIDALQARYTAEGALFKFLATDSTLITDSTDVMLPDSSSAVVRSERFGGFLKIISTATIGDQRKMVQVLVGRSPDAAFDHAVVLGDVHSRLNIAGKANITGDIRVGPLGVKKSAFKGELFEGTLDGTVHIEADSVFPRYADSLYEEERERRSDWTGNPPGNVQVIKPGRYRASRIARYSPPILYSDGDLEVYASREAWLPDSLTVIASGNLVLDGELRYQPFSHFVAGKELTVGGKVKGRHGLFSAEQMTIKDRVNCSGQFMAESQIQLLSRAYLRFPSVLFLGSKIEGNRRLGRIELAGQAVLDGVALLPLPDKVLADDEARIVIGEQAKIRGGIYNTAQTELHGSILGSAVTFQFYFYHSPTAYINWVKDNTIDISKRPHRFAMPFGFSESKNFEVLDWKEL